MPKTSAEPGEAAVFLCSPKTSLEPGEGAVLLPTRSVGTALTWEQYCSQVGVDPHAARRATLTASIGGMLGHMSGVEERFAAELRAMAED